MSQFPNNDANFEYFNVRRMATINTLNCQTLRVAGASAASGISLANAGIATGNQSLLSAPVNPNFTTKGLNAGTGLSATSTATDITLTNIVTLTDSGTGGESLLNSTTNPDFSTKALNAGTGLSATSTATDITLTNNVT